MKKVIKSKRENGSTNEVAKESEVFDKGCNSKTWSDGEHRIVHELFSSNHYLRFCVHTGEQIVFRENMSIPRVGDHIKIKFLDGSDELEFLKKLFNCKVEIKYQFSQAFNFVVKSVECEISNCDEDSPEYIVIIEPIQINSNFKIKHFNN